MGNMLGRSYVFRENAIQNMGKVADDECYMDVACFNMQQSLELLLKFIIEDRGMQAPKTHDICDLLVFVKTAGFVYSKYDALYEMGDTLTKWETRSRYGSGIISTIEKLRDVYKHIVQLEDEYKEFSDKGGTDACSQLEKLKNSV